MSYGWEDYHSDSYTIMKADRGRVTPNSDEAINYYTNEELKEHRSWFQNFKEWLVELFR